MLLELLQLLPQSFGDGALVLAMIGTAAGAGLWLAGVKISRPLITLLTVLLGAAIGLRLPKWFNWNVSGAGPAVGAAVVLGIAGFALHRMWIGIMLGLVFALWATFAIWLTMHDNHAWGWPTWDDSSTLCTYAKSLWTNLPAGMTRLMPFAAGVAMVSALALCILWPRFTTALNWSAVGLTLLIGLGVSTISRSTHSDALNKIPHRTWTQLASLFVMLALGFALQWRLSATKTANLDLVPKNEKDEEK